jgi:hypothetical protein
MENGPAKTERTRRSRAEIAELIATYRQSGQKQREFCQQRGIGLSTLQNYLRRERSNGQPKQRLGSGSCAEGNGGHESSIRDNRTQRISDHGGSEI